jgi:hypothetical protein
MINNTPSILQQLEISMSSYDFIGIDVAKDKFDIAIEINGRYKHEVFSNNLKGHEEFLRGLISMHHCLGFVWRPQGITVHSLLIF